jgi:hypothetical protein
VVFYSGNNDKTVSIIGYGDKGGRESMTRRPPTIPIDIASRYRPSSFICCNCATTPADFFVTNGSLENPTEVVALCFQCYVQKRRWIWRIIKKNNKRKITQ